jgi:hypothetical protein
MSKKHPRRMSTPETSDSASLEHFFERAIVDACCKAWNDLIAVPEIIKSIANRIWFKRVNS